MFFRAALVVLLLLPISLSAVPAPTPRPQKPLNGFHVGFQFRYWNYQMEIYDIKDGLIYFQTRKDKFRTFTGGDSMTPDELQQLLRECPQTLESPVE